MFALWQLCAAWQKRPEFRIRWFSPFSGLIGRIEGFMQMLGEHQLRACCKGHWVGISWWATCDPHSSVCVCYSHGFVLWTSISYIRIRIISKRWVPVSPSQIEANYLGADPRKLNLIAIPRDSMYTGCELIDFSSLFTYARRLWPLPLKLTRKKLSIHVH